MPVEVKDYPKVIQHRCFKGGGVVVNGADMPGGSFGVIISSDYESSDAGQLVYRSSLGIAKLDGTTRYYSSGTGIQVRLLQPSDAFSIVLK